jgi:hypothetical protein
MRKARIVAVVAATLAISVSLTACFGGDTKSKADPAQQIADNRQNYTPKNDVEGKNYNARQKIADNPATILWCTAFPANPSAPAITVPIVGKLTSSNKRPYATSQVIKGSSDQSYNPEIVGPDGMYGSSTEYRYGFRPDGTYVDFTGLSTICSTEPSVFQRTKTIIDLQSDGNLQAANVAAQAALKAGNPALAQKLLVDAVGGK